MGLSRFIKKSLIFFSLFCVVFILSACDDKPDILKKSEKIKLSTCPTFQSFFEGYENIDLISSDSTIQSLDLLKSGKVDYAIGGRTPKSGETFDYIILGTGYSFLSKNNLTISNDDLKNKSFYTDLDDLEHIKKIFGIKNLEKAENAYDYVEKKIIITSWENTDYSKADIVHVLHTNGERYIESRIPILYCTEKCDKDIAITIKDILNI